MTDVEIKTALSELHAVALTLWGEAASEPIEGLVGVANVIAHRRAKSLWGWKTVVHQRAQFSCWSPVGGPAEKANYERVMSAARLLVAGQTVGAAGWQRCLVVADLLLADALRDFVNGARHYCTVALFKAAPPRWAAGRTPDVELGHHVFFVGVP